MIFGFQILVVVVVVVLFENGRSCRTTSGREQQWWRTIMQLKCAILGSMTKTVVWKCGCAFIRARLPRSGSLLPYLSFYPKEKHVAGVLAGALLLVHSSFGLILTWWKHPNSQKCKIKTKHHCRKARSNAVQNKAVITTNKLTTNTPSSSSTSYY